MPETGLGRLLKELREERGLTLREVAQLGDVDHAYVYRLETGAKESPSDEVLAKLIRALKPSKREVVMMKFLAIHPQVDPELVGFTRKDSAIGAEEFQMMATAVFRGPRPDYQILLNRIRRIMREEG